MKADRELRPGTRLATDERKDMGASWVGVAFLAGATFALVGIVFAWPATHVRVWRLGAWLASAVVFAAHIGYERFWLRNPPSRGAWHVGLAVALGAFGLAAGANIHSMSMASVASHRRLLRLSLLIWPIVTSIPAFLVALVVNLALARVQRNRRDE